MKFIPEKVKIINSISLLAMISVTIMVIILRESNNILTKSIMFIIIGFLLVGGIIFIVYLKTLIYEIDEKALKISSFFSFRDIKIPLEDIIHYTERITLINQTGIAGLISQRFSMGIAYIEGMGKVDMYITSSKKSFYIATEYGTYGVSPENREKFSNELRKHGIKEKYREREVLSKDIIQSQNKLRQYFLLNSVMILILIGLPNALFYFKQFPKYICLSQIGSSMLSFVPAKNYIDRVIGYAVITFIATIAFYILAQVYAKINKIFFYRLMIIPLVLIFLQLLSLANVLVTIFF